MIFLLNGKIIAQSNFYYSFNKKTYIKSIDSLTYLKQTNTKNKEDKQNLKMFIDKKDFFLEDSIGNNYIIKSSKKILLQKLNKNDYSIVDNVYEDDEGFKLCLTDQIILSISKKYTIDDLLKFLKPYNIDKVLSRPYGENTYIITIPQNSSYNSFELCQKLFESTIVKYAHPNFINIIKLATTDTYFNDQWALNNTGQSNGTSGVDIGVLNAWNYTKGSSSIKIAVIDVGVDLTHPDLIDNILPGYDATGRGVNGAYEGNDSHGTGVAGIIAAKENNIGVVGIAPNCKIIPIKIGYNEPIVTTTTDQVADGIHHAWYVLDADILSISLSLSPSESVNNEIVNATRYGRQNKGCIIAVSTGNNDGSLLYPSYLNEVIGVGAISMCNERKKPTSCDGENGWGSNYGPSIDIVAPGVQIYTTDLQGKKGLNTYIYDGDYVSDFNGTSSACPHVSGVAALILSQSLNKNLNLTTDDVKHILELSAVDIPPTGFDNETGFGRLNANNALSFISDNKTIVRNESIGGTSNLVQSSINFVYTGGGQILTNGTYNVDRYEITKHINFDIPFCSIPNVWIRERESICASASNPNDGYPYAKITNITTTGFDIKTFTFHINSNSSGQGLQWLPCDPSQIKVAYTAIGEGINNEYCTCETLINNTTYNSNQTINGCNITVQNSTIQNNSTVTFDAFKNTILNSGFQILSGSTLIVNP